MLGNYSLRLCTMLFNKPDPVIYLRLRFHASQWLTQLLATRMLERVCPPLTAERALACILCRFVCLMPDRIVKHAPILPLSVTTISFFPFSPLPFPLSREKIRPRSIQLGSSLLQYFFTRSSFSNCRIKR